jgi:hypothetical protein
MVVTFANSMAGKEKAAFLSWVSDLDFEQIHQNTYAKKHEQTCDWLIKEAKYQQWCNNPVSSLLWCYGKRKQTILLDHRGMLTTL